MDSGSSGCSEDGGKDGSEDSGDAGGEEDDRSGAHNGSGANGADDHDRSGTAADGTTGRNNGESPTTAVLAAAATSVEELERQYSRLYAAVCS